MKSSNSIKCEFIAVTTEPEMVAFASDDCCTIDYSAEGGTLLHGHSWEAPEETLIIPSYKDNIEDACQSYLRELEIIDIDNHPKLQTLMDRIEDELDVTLKILSNAGSDHQPAAKRLQEQKLLRSTTFALNRSLGEMAAYDTKIAKLSQALQMTLSQVDVLGELFSRANQGRIDAEHRSAAEKESKQKRMEATELMEQCTIKCQTPKSMLTPDELPGEVSQLMKKKSAKFLSERQLYRAKPGSEATLHLFGRGSTML